jgi:predicted Fe-S protein YdhL (DUF1289 family)
METPFEVGSPCVGVCRIGPGGLCEGCLRTRDEIAAWPGLGRERRLALLDELGRRRQADARRTA